MSKLVVRRTPLLRAVAIATGSYLPPPTPPPVAPPASPEPRRLPSAGDARSLAR